MKIKLDSQIIIDNPTSEVAEWIKTELSIPNPEIQKKQAMGFYAREYTKEN